MPCNPQEINCEYKPLILEIVWQIRCLFFLRCLTYRVSTAEFPFRPRFPNHVFGRMRSLGTTFFRCFFFQRSKNILFFFQWLPMTGNAQRGISSSFNASLVMRPKKRKCKAPERTSGKTGCVSIGNYWLCFQCILKSTGTQQVETGTKSKVFYLVISIRLLSA